MEPNKFQSVREILEKIETEKHTLEFMATGFPSLDQWLDGGFFKQELVVIGGHSGFGKSYLAGTLLYNIARNGFKCGYFSLEISSKMIVSRMLGAISNIKPTRIMMGLSLTPAEQTAKAQAKADVEILNDNVFLYDDVYELEKILPEIEKNKFDFVVIDFIQNVITEGDKDEYSRLSRVALELQKAAKKYNCMILALSQLSNMVAREGSKGKVLEYKGSGSIATVCDLGFFIDRENSDWVPNMDTLLKLELRKNRRGGTGMVFDLYFRVPGGKIYE